MGKKRLIKVIDLLLIFALAVGINLEFFIMPTLSAPPYDGDWLINTDSTFSGETYNMYYDIIINSGINVEFKSCTFNFLNSSAGVRILIKDNSNVTFENCIFNATESGRGYIEVQNASVLFNDSIFDSLGYSSNMGLKLDAYNITINNSRFIGPYCGLEAFAPPNLYKMKILNSNFDSGSSSLRTAVNINNWGNITIKNNTIEGYINGIYMNNYINNIIIENNTLSGMSEDGIILWGSNGGTTTYYINVSNNEIQSDLTGILLLNDRYSVISHNHINSDKFGMQLDNIFNVSVIANSINYYSSSNSGAGSNHGEYSAFQIGANNLLLLVNNSLITSGNYSERPVSFFNFINYAAINPITNINNKYNGKSVLLFQNTMNYSTVFDFTNDSNTIGSISVLKCEGITLKNLLLNNEGSLYFANSSNIIIQNITLKDSYQALTIENSRNISINKMVYEFENNLKWIPINLVNDMEILINDSQVGKTFMQNETDLQDGLINIVGNSLFRISESELYNSSMMIILDNSLNTSITSNEFRGASVLGIHQNCNHTLFTNNTVDNLNLKDIVNIVFAESNLCDTNITKNHWSQNKDARDLNKDGYADSPFKAGEYDNGGDINDTMPLFIDQDDDGLDMFQEEYLYLTNFTNNDTDGDLISDGDEVYGVIGRITNPNLVDTDGDGIDDLEEQILGSDGYITDPTKFDTDNDLFGDLYEILHHTDPTDPNSYPGGPLNENNTEVIEEEENNQQQNTVGTIDGYSTIIFIAVLISAMSLIVINVYIKDYKTNCKKLNGHSQISYKINKINGGD
ncbi:MAG: NosD domain-containing protein [Promethearchaeota archaeon]